MSMIFSEWMLPESLAIDVSSGKESKELVVELREGRGNGEVAKIAREKHVYVQEHGALYYELEEYKLKYRRVFFRAIFVKVCAAEVI